MAFNIVLQRNNSERERLTKDITNLLTVSGVLKSETSIIDPVIMIECDLDAVKNCNYMTISAFGRSYFVNNIRSIRNGLVLFFNYGGILTNF